MKIAERLFTNSGIVNGDLLSELADQKRLIWLIYFRPITHLHQLISRIILPHKREKVEIDSPHATRTRPSSFTIIINPGRYYNILDTRAVHRNSPWERHYFPEIHAERAYLARKVG